MSDIENDRKKLSIIGYNHPTEIAVTNPKKGNKKYKTLNTESKEKDYVSSKQKSNYAKYTDKVDQNICPDCGDNALMECNCVLKDKQCSKGHVWYFNKDDSITLGDPHD